MKNASTDLLGVDIGGTNVKIGVIDSEYNVKEFIKFKTEKDDVDAMLGSICGVIRDLSQKYSFDFVGVGSPGRIEDNRTVIEAGNIAYDNTPCADIIEQKTGLPVYLDNDANCALYGEKFAGAGKNISDMLVLTIGTGVGGGIMIGRKCYRGHNGRAGELGHFIMDISGEPCSCGLRGCFEQFASVTAFVKAARKAAGEHKDSILYEMAQGDPSRIGGRLPFYAMYRGCEVARGVIDEYIRHLADGINSLAKMFQPEMIVLTGGIMNEGPIITQMLAPHFMPFVNCTLSPLHGNAGLIGAALIKREREG